MAKVRFQIVSVGKFNQGPTFLDKKNITNTSNFPSLLFFIYHAPDKTFFCTEYEFTSTVYTKSEIKRHSKLANPFQHELVQPEVINAS